MARSDVWERGLNLLNRWPKVMGEVEYRFNQIQGDGVMQFPECQNRVYVQFERDNIASALVDAVTRATQYLGYPPAPMWITDEDCVLNSDLNYDAQILSTRLAYVKDFGKRATASIAEDVAVDYTDTNEDGTPDIATIEVTGVEDIDADEITVFFTVADGAAGAAHECWQIAPLTVTKDGDTATITGPRHLFVNPALWADEYRKATSTSTAGWVKNDGDVKKSENFITSVDVYRVYADPTDAAVLICNPRDASVNPAVTASLSNAEDGYFTLHTASDQSAPEFRPSQVRLNYRAGLPLVKGQMDAQLERAIIRYSNVLLPATPEWCSRQASMWTSDNAESPNASAYDSWHPPAFGASVAGMNLMGIVETRRHKLKGRSTRPYN